MRSLLESQRQFMAALYAAAERTDGEGIVAAGLDPAARLRIYRHSCEAGHLDALRTSYPAVRALVGDAFFEQSTRNYHRDRGSNSGNLQDFGDDFGDWLERSPATRALAWLGDVARLEWLRQRAALAPDTPARARRFASDAGASVRGGVETLASRHPIVTIFRYAMAPGDARLQLPESGENAVVWRSGDEVAVAAIDAASFAFLAALRAGAPLATAAHRARARDQNFDAQTCLASFAAHGIVAAASR